MKVAWIGNLANVGFKYVKLLRKAGVEAELWLQENKLHYDGPGNPDHEYPGASTEPWVRTFPMHYGNYAANKMGCLGIITREEVEMANADVIQAQTCNEIAALRIAKHFGKPYVGCCTGSDLSEVAKSHTRFGRLYVRALQGARHVFLTNINQWDMTPSLDLEGISFLPFPVELGYVKPNNSGIIYMISRLDFTKKHPSGKGNDVFFEAWNEYIKTGWPGTLWVSDWGVDQEAARKYLYGKRCVFVPLMNKQAFKDRLAKAELVVDQFHCGSLGLGAVEAMAVGRPVMGYVDQSMAFRAYHDIIPLANCIESNDALLHLMSLNTNALAERSYQWVREHHSDAAIVDHLLHVYASVVQR